MRNRTVIFEAWIYIIELNLFDLTRRCNCVPCILKIDLQIFSYCFRYSTQQQQEQRIQIIIIVNNKSRKNTLVLFGFENFIVNLDGYWKAIAFLGNV